MYRTGYQIAGVGCASLGAPCGSRLGYLPADKTFDYDGWYKHAASELKSSDLTPPDPEWYWSMAMELAEDLDVWLTNLKLGPPWIPGSRQYTYQDPDAGSVNPDYLEAIVSANTALRKIVGFLDAAKATGIELGPEGSMRRVRQVPRIEEHVAHIATILAAYEQAMLNTHAGMIATVRGQIAQQGSDTGGYLGQLGAIWRHLGLKVNEDVVEPAQQVIDDVLDKAGKGAEQLVKSNMVKWGIAVAGIALVAYFALKR